MQIFVPDPDPVKSALALDDLRLNKMVLESAQLLSNAVQAHAPDLAPLVYKRTHFNAPVSKWARETRTNYCWLLVHFTALAFEKLYRTEKPHRSLILTDTFREAVQFIPVGDQTGFVNSTDFKDEPNVITAYRMCLLDKWLKGSDVRGRTWTRRKPPEWVRLESVLEDQKTVLSI